MENAGWRPSIETMSIDSRIACLFAALVPLALMACRRPPAEPPKPSIYAETMCGGQPRWGKQGIENGELVTFNELVVGPSSMLWNASTIDWTTLEDYLKQTKVLSPQPVTVLIVKDRANCDDVWAVRHMMESQLRCSVEKRCVEYSPGQWALRPPRPY